MGSFVLAMDGGGTKTAGLVADADGNLHQLASARGCNLQDGTDWKDALGSMFDQVSDVDFAVIGIPGFGEIPDDDARVSDFITARLGADHLIINDVELAFRGAFPSGDGVLVLAGTGSMTIGRADGAMRRSGGWGHWLGDEGSAFWIGQQALSKAAAELDSRAAQTGFAAALAGALHAPSHRFGLLDWAMQDEESRARIASVARVVDDLSLSGDPVAGAILDGAAAHLADLVTSVSPKPVPWAHAGSVFKSARILETVSGQMGPPTPPTASTLVGGLIHAATLAEWNVNSGWRDKIATQEQHL